MAPTVWFRGEGVNVAPAAAGGVTHDFDDGVYYTDSLDVAKQYARERAPVPGDQRVYQVSLEMQNLRVLDLNKHPEWINMMREKLPNGMTTEQFLRSFPSSQQYNSFFKSFLRKTGLKIESFDAVVGPEFRLGGTQMCVLHKGGVPSTIAETIKTTRVPVGGAPIPAQPGGRLRFSGKIGPGLKATFKGTARTVGAAVALAIVGWFVQKLIDDATLKDISKKVEEQVAKMTAEIVEIQSTGRKAFVNVTIENFETEEWMVVMGLPDPQQVTSHQFRLGAVAISDQDISKPFGANPDETQRITSTVTYYISRSVNSVEVGLSKDEVDLYSAFKQELLWYEKTLLEVKASEDVQRLSREKVELEAKFRAAFN
ncbi:hypothetical protein [Terrarubrum flagellatum]|uniref:hypothetical protein n=1 Tax=Terrirubrum flagellatum TaxID=2895980 RepID=UPI003145535E